jgi:hypothetical protein
VEEQVTQEPLPTSEPQEQERAEAQTPLPEEIAVSEPQEQQRAEVKAVTEPENTQARISDLESQIESLRQRERDRELQDLTAKATNQLREELSEIQERMADIYEDYQLALENQDTVRSDRLAKQYNKLSERANSVQQNYRTRFEEMQKDVQRERAVQFEKTLTAFLKTEGLDLAELRRGKEDLNITNPFEVIKAVIKASSSAHKSEIDDLKKRLSQAEGKARKEWSATSPAARPEGSSRTGGSASTGFSISKASDYFKEAFDKKN